MAIRQEWDIRRVLLVLSRWWWWPTLTIVSGLISAWLYLRYTVAIYRSEATIQIDPKRSLAAPLARQSGGADYGLTVEVIAEKYLELFNDYEVIREVIRQEKFNLEFYSIGKFGSSLIYPTPLEIDIVSKSDSVFQRTLTMLIEVSDSLSYKILRDEQVVKVGSWGKWTDWEGLSFRLRRTRPLAPGRYLLIYRPVEEVVTYWLTRIQVMPKRGFTVLSVMVADISPQRAQAFCNAVLRGVKVHEQDIQREYYNQIIAYIDTLLDIVLLDIEKAQDTIRKAETAFEVPLSDIRSKLLFDRYQSYAESSISSKYEELDQLGKQLQALYNQLHREADSLPLLIIPPSLSEASGDLQGLNEKIKNYNALSRQYAPNSALLVRLLEDLRLEFELALRSIEAEKRFLITRDQYASKYVSGELPRFYRDMDRKRRLDLINFNWESKKKLYEMLIERRLQMSIERSGVTSLIRVTQPPTVPFAPLSPNRIQVYVVLILLGLVVGIGGVFLREILTQQVSYRRDIESISPVPVIAEVPAMQKRGRDYNLGVGYLSNLQLEVLRSLRSGLDFLWEKEGPRVVIVTSIVSGEGKTYLSSALAYIYALAGRRVLLIDADLRRASLTQRQGLMQAPGLSTLLAASAERSENGLCPQPTWVNFLLEDLYLLPSGPLPPNAAELLATSRLKELILGWQTEFDYFIFDTSPVGLVPDALSILSQFPEAITLYVFRADYSRYTFLNHLEDIVKQHHLKKVYLLFNGTKLSRPHYGYGYGYGYYGDGYGAARYYYVRRRSSWQERVRKWIPL